MDGAHVDASGMLLSKTSTSFIVQFDDRNHTNTMIIRGNIAAKNKTQLMNICIDISYMYYSLWDNFDIPARVDNFTLADSNLYQIGVTVPDVRYPDVQYYPKLVTRWADRTFDARGHDVP